MALLIPSSAAAQTVRTSYRGGAGKDMTLTMVQPPAAFRMAGPCRLGNGWLQILGGITPFDDFQPHRWESSEDIANTNGWTPLGPDFIPAEEGTILTITNTAAFPQRFFRLTAL